MLARQIKADLSLPCVKEFSADPFVEEFLDQPDARGIIFDVENGAPVSLSFFDNPLDSGIQRRRVNWLNQVFQKAGCPALSQIGVRAEAAQRDAVQPMLRPQFFEQLAARGVRQRDVTDEQIEAFFAGE